MEIIRFKWLDTAGVGLKNGIALMIYLPRFERCRRVPDGESGWRLEMFVLWLGGSLQDQDVRARRGQARGDQRVPVSSVWEILSDTKIFQKS